MNIGWIDFSERDRRKAIDIIHLLQEQGAIDELGIGAVRDGFSNVFFPGSSTIQTRAKYFFIVPYAIKTCCDNLRYNNLGEILKALDDLERSCALTMIQPGKDREGVIGSDVLGKNKDKWVVRRPSSIYWNGIRTLGLLTDKNMSIKECIVASVSRRRKDRVSNWMEFGEENEQDDRDAGHEALTPLWNLPRFPKNWMENLEVSLSSEEARWLRGAINGLDGSLYRFVLGLDDRKLAQYTSYDAAFRSLYEDQKDAVSEDLRRLMQMAVKTDTLIYLCRILFNRRLSEDRNNKAMNEWSIWTQEPFLSEIKSLDLDVVFSSLRLQGRERLKSFLEDMRGFILSGDETSAMGRLEDWEVELKGEKRSKLKRRNEFKDSEWIGGRHLDYRLLSAVRIIKDIHAAEGLPHV